MKFLVDAMLGKLARFLRIFGYDTVYANDLIDYYDINPVPDFSPFIQLSYVASPLRYT